MNSAASLFVIILFTVILFGCKNKKQQNPEQLHAVSFTAIDLDNRLKSTDSLVVVFYKDPYGDDSLRYTRFYAQAPVTAPKGIAALQQELTQKFEQQPLRRHCRSEGKIWCFTKGKIFQTLYFSTRCTDCCFMYLIKDGNFYYSKILPSTAEWLASLKPIATEPANTGDAE